MMIIGIHGKPGGAGLTVIFVWPCPFMYPVFAAIAVMVTSEYVDVCGVVKTNVQSPFMSVFEMMNEKVPPPSDDTVTTTSATGFVLDVT